MNIEGIIWLRSVVDKLAFKHHIETYEVEELFAGKPKFRFVEKGGCEGKNVYMALGQTDAGRYLTALFIYKRAVTFKLISDVSFSTHFPSSSTRSQSPPSRLPH
jgi:hypothetical protein